MIEMSSKPAWHTKQPGSAPPSFATYAITDTLAGTGLADHLAGTGGQYFAIFADGHKRQLPRLTGGP